MFEGPPKKDPTTNTSGATQLPYTLPAGSYFNSASYPLQLVLTPEPNRCYDHSIYVQNERVARASDDCEASFTSVTAVVPPMSSFYILESEGRSKTVVTALKNDATWEETGIFFVVWSSYQQTGPCDPATHRMDVLVSEQQNTGFIYYSSKRSCDTNAMIP